MARKAKPKPAKPKPILKDILGEVVREGDAVVVLWKVRAFRGLADAELWTTTYLGKGQYGFMFGSGKRDPVYIKKPELVKVSGKRVVKVVETTGLKKEVVL